MYLKIRGKSFTFLSQHHELITTVDIDYIRTSRESKTSSQATLISASID